MDGLNAVEVEKLGARIAEPAGADHFADRAKERVEAFAEVEAGGFHSWTPFSTASSSSLTFTKIEPPSL